MKKLLACLLVLVSLTAAAYARTAAPTATQAPAQTAAAAVTQAPGQTPAQSAGTEATAQPAAQTQSPSFIQAASQAPAQAVAPAPAVELGVGKLAFRMQVIDAKTDEANKTPAVYVDVAYESRLEDKTVGNHFAQLDDLMALTMQKDAAGAFTGLKAVSYETNPITEYPERLNDGNFAWKVFINGQPKDMQAIPADGDLVQVVYTDSQQAPQQADDKLANRYYFVKNNTVCYDFAMALHADAQTILAQGDYKLYVPLDKAPALALADLVQAVCAHHGLDYAFDGMSVSIGDYIAEQDARGNYHFWYMKDDASGFNSSLALGGEWGLKAGAGMQYALYYK